MLRKIGYICIGGGLIALIGLMLIDSDKISISTKESKEEKNDRYTKHTYIKIR